jgi:MFS family permease
LPAGFRRFLVAVLLFGTGDFARTLLILRAAQLLTPQYGAPRAAAIGVFFFAIHNVVAALCAYPIGVLADRVSPRRLLVVGYALGVLTAVLAALAQPSLFLLTLLFVCAGLVIGIEETLESVLTAKLIDARVRGSAYGALAATNGVGDLISSSLVGIVWTAFGPGVAFASAGVACALGAAVLGLAVADPAEPADAPAG